MWPGRLPCTTERARLDGKRRGDVDRECDNLAVAGRVGDPRGDRLRANADRRGRRTGTAGAGVRNEIRAVVVKVPLHRAVRGRGRDRWNQVKRIRKGDIVLCLALGKYHVPFYLHTLRMGHRAIIKRLNRCLHSAGRHRCVRGIRGQPTPSAALVYRVVAQTRVLPYKSDRPNSTLPPCLRTLASD